jgi:flavin reductase (DIM6/NTAB) family NADH-FMN oxidoreductase RutF
MEALFKTISSGVYVVGVAHRNRHNAFTAAWVTQVSYQPLLLGMSVNPQNWSYGLIRAERAFAVSVLTHEQSDLARRFGTQSGRTRDKLAAVTWFTGKTGAPILTDALAYFDCELQITRRAGDHVVIIGRVIDGAVLKPSAQPMVYAQTGDLDTASALYPSEF